MEPREIAATAAAVFVYGLSHATANAWPLPMGSEFCDQADAGRGDFQGSARLSISRIPIGAEGLSSSGRVSFRSTFHHDDFRLKLSVSEAPALLLAYTVAAHTEVHRLLLNLYQVMAPAKELRLSPSSAFLPKLRGGTCSTAHPDPPDATVRRAIHVRDDVLLAVSEALAEKATKEHFAKAYELVLASLLPRPDVFVKDAESCMYMPTKCSMYCCSGFTSMLTTAMSSSTPTWMSAKVDNSFERRVSASTAASTLGKLDQMLKSPCALGDITVSEYYACGLHTALFWFMVAVLSGLNKGKLLNPAAVFHKPLSGLYVVLNIRELCDQVLALSEYKAELYAYLRSRMNTIAPNLTALVGELVGACFLAHGRSLLNLAKAIDIHLLDQVIFLETVSVDMNDTVLLNIFSRPISFSVLLQQLKSRAQVTTPIKSRAHVTAAALIVASDYLLLLSVAIPHPGYKFSVEMITYKLCFPLKPPWQLPALVGFIDDGLHDVVDDHVDKDHEHEAEDAIPTEPTAKNVAAPPSLPRDNGRQLSKKVPSCTFVLPKLRGCGRVRNDQRPVGIESSGLQRARQNWGKVVPLSSPESDNRAGAAWGRWQPGEAGITWTGMVMECRNMPLVQGR
ncbi:unnamed protein product [Miscanthus lutarioriparius]|uniref:Nop domain-containing protein n=1 Tax=Miscanthus lutarioriparius TaxID=422564 RepID=A0A811S5C3_9POAL|nr:unnamed protein product [Miscanthus lutarioriparius]